MRRSLLVMYEFLSGNWPKARLLFLCAFLWVTVYWAMKHFGVLERTVWNIPGFAMAALSLPWSQPLVDILYQPRHVIPREFGPMVFLIAIASGFGVNCVLAFYALSGVRCVLRITRRSRGHAASGAPLS
jgi:drug/metabolite transporter (DMT)-like permease